MIVAVVTVAGTSLVYAWVGQVLRAHFVTGVRWQHECVHQVVVHESRHLHLSVPGVHGQNLLSCHLCYRRLVVRDLHIQVGSSVVKHTSEGHVLCRFRENFFVNLSSFIVELRGDVFSVGANISLEVFL